MNQLTIHDWDEHQSYRKDRGQPPWIKVHRHVMRNIKWVALDDAERGQLVAIWLLAADHNGVIPASPELVQKLCFMSSPPDLNKFMDLGFLDGDRRHVDAKPTPDRRQHDQPKAETEADKSREETDICAHKSRFEEFWDAYPRKKGNKGSAEATWRKRKMDVIADQILDDVCRRAEIEWIDRQFIPYPTTYLNAQTWKTEIEDNRNENSTRTGGNGSRARRVADTLDDIIRNGLPEERAERMGGGDIPETASGVRNTLDGEYRRH